jgi:hypothetical protein
MRDDMAKVIVERPRRGGGLTRKGRERPLEHLPFGEGMRRPHVRQYRGKQLNENLAPLRRYLDRQVGRPWRKVFAEIAANLRVASTVDQHVRDHVRDFVALKPQAGINDFWHRADGIWGEDFYVDPADGLLKRTADLPALRRRRRLAAERRRAKREVTRIALAPDRELRRIDGIWYELLIAKLPQPVYRAQRETQRIASRPDRGVSRTAATGVAVRRLVTAPVRDALTGALRHAGPQEDTPEAWSEFRRRHRDPSYVAAKRQLGRRDLLRHGLVNLAPTA